MFVEREAMSTAFALCVLDSQLFAVEREILVHIVGCRETLQRQVYLKRRKGESNDYWDLHHDTSQFDS